MSSFLEQGWFYFLYAVGNYLSKYQLDYMRRRHTCTVINTYTKIVYHRVQNVLVEDE